MAVALTAGAGVNFRWLHEPASWLYIAALWAGGLKVWLGTYRPIAEIDSDGITLRPLHQLRSKRVAWPAVLGTEQMTPGDRLILYYETPRGMRFVAVNLNLIRGRAGFSERLDGILKGRGFVEKIVERSRYLTREGGGTPG